MDISADYDRSYGHIRNAARVKVQTGDLNTTYAFYIWITFFATQATKVAIDAY